MYSFLIEVCLFGRFFFGTLKVHCGGAWMTPENVCMEEERARVILPGQEIVNWAWRHFWLSQQVERGSWFLMGWDQGGMILSILYIEEAPQQRITQSISCAELERQFADNGFPQSVSCGSKRKVLGRESGHPKSIAAFLSLHILVMAWCKPASSDDFCWLPLGSS